MKNHMKIFLCLVICFLSIYSLIPDASAQARKITFDSLSKGQKINGFRSEAVYLNDNDQAMGGRFVHERTGFMLDLLEIQSVPQAFVWVNSFPVSNQGEPHTQEHLLITKGNKGRNLNGEESMSMAGSTAGTYQYFTVYGFDTSAGNQAFFPLFNSYLDALLNPDYSDEEIRREVRNWGVTQNPDKTLRLEEKGSVYNEMVSSSKNQNSILYKTMSRLVYGQSHPLSLDSGGTPEGIRIMKAEDIKKFHEANHHLGNMGAVLSLPKEITLQVALGQLNNIFGKLQGGKKVKSDFRNTGNMPSFQPAEIGKIQIAEYPDENEKQTGAMLFGYSAMTDFDLKERIILSNFLTVFGNGANSNLYKKFIDSKTREMDLGSKNVFAGIQPFPGDYVYLTFSETSAENLTEEKAKLVRKKVMEEVSRVAEFKDNSPELKEFNERATNNLIASQRASSKYLSTPPEFSARRGGYGYFWFLRTRELNQTNDFRKSVTFKNELAEIKMVLASGKNIWRDYIAKWKLAEVSPYIAISLANPKLIEKDEKERAVRAENQIDFLKKKYGVPDSQEAIRRYQADEDRITAELEKLEKSNSRKFIRNPPLTLDDSLDYSVSKLNNVPFFAANFDSMSSSTTGFAFRTDVIPEDELVYLTILPTLLRSVGVIKDGKPISYQEMTEIQSKEILSMSIGFSNNYKTNRYELVVRGSGNNFEESEKAIEWVKIMLQSPNWRKENLPRIRDVVDQRLSSLRTITQGAEENWVTNPANAYQRQDSPIYLATSSIFTQRHNLQRFRWMLKDAGDSENQEAISGFLSKLGEAKASRDELKSLLAEMQNITPQAEKLSDNLKRYFIDFNRLPATSRILAAEVARDLAQTLSDIPDSTLSADWNYLCQQMKQDLTKTPEKALADLDNVRSRILNNQNVRTFFIGSSITQKKLESETKNLLNSLENKPLPRASYSKARRIEDRLVARVGTKEKPVFVGLLAPNMSGGVIINNVPFVDYKDTKRESLLDFLAANIYGGSGPNSAFTKTLNAGLAYSNGIGNSPNSGTLMYYAERTPELPQTLRYIIEEIKKPYFEGGISEYSIALAFYSRSGDSFESRGEAMAADLADGLTPEVVKKFRTGILELRKVSNLSAELVKRKDKVYERVLPGYGIKAKEVDGANYFVIGPEKQMMAYEAYLKSTNNSDSALHRIYPRDFWIIDK